MRYLAIVAVLLSGCVGGVPAGISRYDLVQAASPSVRHPDLLLRSVEVRAPSWLDSPAMQYRLAYTLDSRREAYAQSRWLAPPAALLERALQHRLLADASGTQAAGCRLFVELGEFVQVFDAPGASRSVLEIRATLSAPRGGMLLARRAFSQSPPAGPDARGSAAAFSVATAMLGDDLLAWLAGLARDTPEVTSRCRN